MTIGRRIGIDFDNTIIGYDEVFLSAAMERGLLPNGFAGSKQAIRDAIRLLADGELAWQHLQGYVYGRGMGDAVMFEGLDRFLRRCRREGHSVLIVSHKTEYGHYDPDRVNLRETALGWMRDRGFFSDEGFGIPEANVFFEGTRSEKLKRIAALGCTDFVDDLEEVLQDPEFPPGVRGILLANKYESDPLPYQICPTWWHVEEAIFRGRD